MANFVTTTFFAKTRIYNDIFMKNGALFIKLLGARESEYIMLNAQYLDKKSTIFLEIFSQALYIYCLEGVGGFLAKSFASTS